MTRCCIALRACGRDANSLEAVADRIVRHLADGMRDRDGARQCALVRCFKTHPYGELDGKLQSFARDVLGGSPASPDTKCLTLLASAGERPEWNSRHTSAGHRALPLLDAEAVSRFPMIAALVQELGVGIGELLAPPEPIVIAGEPHAYSVFYVPDAAASPWIYAQEEFVIPFGIRSVIGFGGLLPDGELIATLLFARVPVAPETAQMFATIALSVELAALPHIEAQTFEKLGDVSRG
ncbi:MAG TPA: hypothetical protein VIJ51_07525 [Solirubrobacteraceae bacterium]